MITCPICLYRFETMTAYDQHVPCPELTDERRRVTKTSTKEQEAAEFNRRYKEAGGCPCWIEVSLHDGHCCFDKDKANGCQHDQQMMVLLKEGDK